MAARDATWDGRFVYAVTSTSIFCRPSCPSRRPRPDRIRFFMHPGQAVDAGFRACKRCSPDTFDPRIESVVEVCRLIEEYADGKLELADLAAATGLSATHLQRTFKSLLGVTPRQYGAMVRRRGFERLLRQGVRPTAAVYEAGYGSARAAYENSGENYGMTPATYGAKGRARRFATRFRIRRWARCSSPRQKAGCARFASATVTTNSLTRYARISLKRLYLAATQN